MSTSTKPRQRKGTTVQPARTGQPARTVQAGKSAQQVVPQELRASTQRLPDTLAFMQLLWAVDHGLRSVSKQMQANLGLTGPQRLAVRLVGRSPQITPSELAALLHLDRGTVTGIIERLEAQRLLLRAPHPEDGRSVRLELTARGRLIDGETTGTVEACVERTLETLPPRLIDAARQVLEALTRELGIASSSTPSASVEEVE